MRSRRNKTFVNPTGIIPISSILLAIARVALGLYLLYTDPLSPWFIYLLVILFTVSVARHLLCYFNHPPDNMYNFLLDLLTPCLYGFILFHVLSIYQSPFLSLSVSIFIPAIIYTYLFAGDPTPVMSKGVFWSGLCCYVLTFLLTLNYVSDFSNPVIEKYLLARKYYVTAQAEDGGPGEDIFYFDLIHADSIAAPAQWMEVNQETYRRPRDNWRYKKIEFDNTTYLILDKKETTYPQHQYHLLLLEANGGFQAQHMTEPEYARYEKGDTFHIEKHKGLLGLQWLTYR
ncbi:hypothetical protein [Chitinophaga sp.]|uniref:hypothetical protein n=1 Tax=Chitinophaga sp. TaxID=1869181 RepID=UPI002F948534